MKKVLLISPYFPPMGVSGAKRPLHLVRNLPVHGWQPVVLAGRPEGEPLDESLAAAIPSGAVVAYEYAGAVRPLLRRITGKKDSAGGTLAGDGAGGFPGQRLRFLSPFDRYLLDTPAALRAGMRLIRDHRPAAIHVMADPWSGLIAALRLHRRSGLPLIVDLRDPWSVHEAKMALRPPIARWWLRRFERRLFLAAGKVVLNTDLCREAYQRAYDGAIPAERFTTVRNAFDPGLFSAPPPAAGAGEGFTVMYFGRFGLIVGPEQILQGFSRFVEHERLAPGQAQLHFVGGLRRRDLKGVARLLLADRVTVAPPVPFAEGMALLGDADVLILVVEPRCRLQIPGKFFDYLAAGRPILAISANPEVNDLLDRTGAGIHVPWGDPDAVADGFSRLYRERANRGTRAGTPESLRPFTAMEQARRFAAILDEVVGP